MQRQFVFRPSHRLMALLVTAHGAALAALLPLALPVWAKIMLVFLLLSSLWHHLRGNASPQAPSAWVTLTLEGDLVALAAQDGGRMIGRVQRSSLVTPYLIVLNVLPQGSHFPRSAVILPDSLDAESFRQLRVWLKWKYNSPALCAPH